MKICKSCKIEKSYEEFEIRKCSKDGYRNQCKECRKSKQKEYYLNNKESKLETSKQYYIDNKQIIKEKQRTYYSKNKSIKDEYVKNNIKLIKEYQKEYRENNKEKLIEKRKEYYNKNKESMKKRSREDYYKIIEINPNFHKERYKKIKNNESLYLWLKEYREDYKKKNPHIFAWRYLLRSILRRIGKKKENLTLEILGYSALDLKNHIESLFTDGMSWENYGEWHIDHIKPVSMFDPNTEISIINELSNLRPLWSTSRVINDVFYEGNLNRKKYYNND